MFEFQHDISHILYILLTKIWIIPSLIRETRICKNEGEKAPFYPLKWNNVVHCIGVVQKIIYLDWLGRYDKKLLHIPTYYKTTFILQSISWERYLYQLCLSALKQKILSSLDSPLMKHYFLTFETFCMSFILSQTAYCISSCKQGVFFT